MTKNTLTKINSEITTLINKIEESGSSMSDKELDLVCLARETKNWVNSNPSNEDINQVVSNLKIYWMSINHVDMILYKYLS